MKLINRYILHDIVYYFTVFMLAMIAIFVVYEIHDTRTEFLEKSPEIKDIVLFLIFSVPGNLKEVFPFTCWLSTCFAYGILAKNKEILAMVAAGVSFRTLARPALYFGIATTVFYFIFTQTIVPYSLEKARYIERGSIKGKDVNSLTEARNLFVKGAGNRFYIIKRFNGADKTMEFPIMVEISEDGNYITERLQADVGAFVEETGDDGAYWQFDRAERWTFSDPVTISSYQPFDAPLEVLMEENLDKYLAKPKKIEEMNVLELIEARSLRRKQGASDVDTVSYAIQKNLALPFSCIILSLLGFVVVTDVKAHKLLYLGTQGLALAAGFYILNVVGRKLGELGLLPSSVAAWGGLAIYCGVIYYLLKRLNTIR